MGSRHRPLNSVLIKPSGPDCNLGCEYCFYLEKSELFPQNTLHRMTPEIQEETIRQVMQQSGDSVSLGWQGGEPTLMGLDFYKRAIELEKRYGHDQSVGNGLQTNGLLLNKDWVGFLREYNWLVGLSLDGPEHIHNRYRLDKGQQGTHQRVEDNAKMLLDSDVATNAMCCVTNYSVNYPDELYAYFKELGLTYMQFIPIVETDKDDPGKAALFSVSAEDYGKFLVRMFQLWLNDFKEGKPTTSIRHFESVFHSYVGFNSPECTMMKECGPYVVIEHNGNVYSCDFFVEPRWKLGNIMHDRIINMLNSKKQQAFGAAKTLLPRECRICPWLRHCFGGCTKDRIKDPQDQRRPRFCRSYKMFFELADPVLRDWAGQWTTRQAEWEQSRLSGRTYNAFDDFLKK